MRTSIPKNNFSSGQIDRDIKGRVDLPLYQNGHEISRNFFHTVKGDCYYRSGFEFLDEIGNAALYEFKFNQEQSYLLVFKQQWIQFWTYNENNELVKVLDDTGNTYSISHPYGTEVFNLSMTQNCDILYITHKNGKYPEYQLKRTASNKFELNPTTYTNTNTQKSLSSTSESENHGFPCSCAFYENRLNRCSSSKYPTYLYGSKGGEYNNITTGTGTNDGYQFDLAEANSKALWLMSGVNSLLVGTAEGILTVNGGSVTKAITPSDITAKLSCRDGVSEVLPVHKDNYVFFVSSNRRQLYMFEYDVLLEQFKSTNLSKGNYEITKGGIRKLANKFDRFGLVFAVCNGRLLSVCFSNDEAVNSWSEFITEGRFIDICTVTRPDGDYDLFANIKREINGITRYYLERLTETVEFSRFEDFVSEIPNDANEQEIRAIEQDDKYAFYRKIAEELRSCNYLDCSMKYSGLQNRKIEYNPNTKIIRIADSSYILPVYNGEYTSAELTNGFMKLKLPSAITTQGGYSTDELAIFTNSHEEYDLLGQLVNPIVEGKKIYSVVNRTIYNGSYTGTQTTTVLGKSVTRINFSSDVNIFNGTAKRTWLYYTGTLKVGTQLYTTEEGFWDDFEYYIGTVSAVNTSSKTISINADTIPRPNYYYVGDIYAADTSQNTINLVQYDGFFQDTDVGKRIWYKTVTGREYGSFDIVEYIDSRTVRVNPLIAPTSNTSDSWYLSATVFNGLDHLEGETVAVVGNGGYIGDFVVHNGRVDISSANTNKVGTAIIGLKYKGILKSPNLGLMLQGTQTYTNMKNIYKIGLELSFSAGGKVGDSLYHLDEVQDFNPEGLLDVPPLPIDTYREIAYEGTYDKDKYYYIVQDSPLPFHLTMVIPHMKQVSRT